MTVMVTGGAGYIGRHLTRRLLDDGEKVVVLDNLSTGDHNAVPEEADFIEGDVGDSELVGKALAKCGANAVFHLAGSTGIAESFRDPEGFHRNNVSNSRILTGLCLDRGIRDFVFASTAAVYLPHGDAPLVEDADIGPQSPYGESKLTVERILSDAAADSGGRLRCAVLRYFNVAGTDPAMRIGYPSRDPSTLLERAVEAITAESQTVEIFGTDYPTRDGSCIRDFVHVWDLCDAHVAALSHLRKHGNRFVANCGSGQGTSVIELIRTVEAESGKKLSICSAPRRRGDAATIVADVGNLRTLLGWVPRRSSPRNIVADTIIWADKKGRR